jgi:hypothetical protein
MVRAQGQVTTRRIGFLSAFSHADIEGFLNQLRPELESLGWIDGRDIVLLEPRTAEGSYDRLPSLANELVAQRPGFMNLGNEAAAPLIRQMRADTAKLGMQLLVVEVRGKGDFEAAFATIGRENTESILLPPESLIQSNKM